MKVKPFSFSSLQTFDNCEHQYYERYVTKRFAAEADTEEAIEGRRVHKAFENRLCTFPGEALPEDLQTHEAYLAKLEAKCVNNPGCYWWTERGVALDRQRQPCSPTAWDAVWCRMVIDWGWVDEEKMNACCVDYKTGKKKELWRQLALNALYMFASEPTVQRVDSRFYWTQTQEESRHVWGRSEIPILWKEMVPSLTRWVAAHQSDEFVPKPSGLCYGWCPVLDCKHHKPFKPKKA